MPDFREVCDANAVFTNAYVVKLDSEKPIRPKMRRQSLQFRPLESTSMDSPVIV
jgi:hypothetical protein